jgi:hypothetical protein
MLSLATADATPAFLSMLAAQCREDLLKRTMSAERIIRLSSWSPADTRPVGNEESAASPLPCRSREPTRRSEKRSQRPKEWFC